jgi:hypothetical protein
MTRTECVDEGGLEMRKLNDDEKIVRRYKARIGNSPLRAIRSQCVECMGGMVKEIAICPTKCCSLYRFRMGKMPKAGEKQILEYRNEK